jgi:glycosyltransferase involved in cell wall biosynthesis
MKLAIVHDWFVHIGGAERVLIEMHRLWPEAPIHLMIGDRTQLQRYLPDAQIIISPLGRTPFASRIYPYLAPAMPASVEHLDLSAYTTVISSSVIFSKGIVVRPGTRHISYTYSPPRMLWDYRSGYQRKGMLSTFARHSLRTWDYAAAQRPDELVAISHAVADRIKKYWRRDALVIPPPIRTSVVATSYPILGLEQSLPKQYFLIVARLVDHKLLNIVLEALHKTGKHLVIVGEGPLRRSLEKRSPHHALFLGWQPDDVVDQLYENCQAVIVPNEEDFGLTAVEAMSHGAPVLALRAGGAMETVVEGVTGEFFDDPIPEALAEGIHRISWNLPAYNRDSIRKHAEQWSLGHWQSRMRTLVGE